MTTKIFMDIDRAAKESNISKRHFARHLYEGEIPHFNIGQRVFLLRKDFEQWRAKCEKKVVLSS